ncbi:MAG: riboflavin synthase [Phycisphaerales bacterium]|nr:riboflavin synthase [Phycisphaerales bacterium]
MFTGLVQHVGRIAAKSPTQAGVRLLLDPAGWTHQPSPGESICVAGICLTLVAREAGGWAFDAIPETLSKTTLGDLAVGAPVNLEHAATPTTLLGGHVVQGHVDGVGVVTRVQRGDAGAGGWRVEVQPPAGLMPAMIPKGSVCLDGVSLTLASVDPAAGTIEVALIPETLARTTLRDLREGDRINVEADAMAKAVVHVMRHYLAHSERRS